MKTNVTTQVEVDLDQLIQDLADTNAETQARVLSKFAGALKVRLQTSTGDLRRRWLQNLALCLTGAGCGFVEDLADATREAEKRGRAVKEEG